MFTLHPYGKRVAVSFPDGGFEERRDEVTFVFNFFEELERLAPID